MSKGSFKRAIGHLYKQKIINIETGKITLTKKVGVELSQKNNHFTRIVGCVFLFNIKSDR